MAQEAPELSCQDYKNRFQSLQMRAFDLVSNLKDSEGNPLGLLNLQEEFDLLSAQLSVYQGLHNLHQQVSGFIGKSNPDPGQSQNAFLNFALADSVVEMAKDFDLGPYPHLNQGERELCENDPLLPHCQGGPSRHSEEQLYQHLEDKCESEGEKHVYCRLQEEGYTDNPLFASMLNNLVSGYVVASTSTRPQTASSTPFGNEIHTLFNNPAMRGKVANAFLKLRIGDIGQEQAQADRMNQVIADFYTSTPTQNRSLDNNDDGIDFRNIETKMREIKERLEILNNAINQIHAHPEYKELEWFKNYAAFQMRKKCSYEEDKVEFITPTDSNCLPSLGPSESPEEVVQFAGEFIGFISEKEEGFINQELASACQRVHSRLNGVTQPGPFRVYRREYAHFCAPWFDEGINVMAQKMAPEVVFPNKISSIYPDTSEDVQSPPPTQRAPLISSGSAGFLPESSNPNRESRNSVQGERTATNSNTEQSGPIRQGANLGSITGNDQRFRELINSSSPSNFNYIAQPQSASSTPLESSPIGIPHITVPNRPSKSSENNGVPLLSNGSAGFLPESSNPNIESRNSIRREKTAANSNTEQSGPIRRGANLGSITGNDQRFRELINSSSQPNFNYINQPQSAPPAPLESSGITSYALPPNVNSGQSPSPIRPLASSGHGVPHITTPNRPLDSTPTNVPHITTPNRPLDSTPTNVPHITTPNKPLDSTPIDVPNVTIPNRPLESSPTNRVPYTTASPSVKGGRISSQIGSRPNQINQPSSFTRTTIYKDRKGNVTGSYTRAKNNSAWLMAFAQISATSAAQWYTTGLIHNQHTFSGPAQDLYWYVPPASNPWANYTNQDTWRAYNQYMQNRVGGPNPFAHPAYFNRTFLGNAPQPYNGPGNQTNFGLP